MTEAVERRADAATVAGLLPQNDRLLIRFFRSSGIGLRTLGSQRFAERQRVCCRSSRNVVIRGRAGIPALDAIFGSSSPPRRNLEAPLSGLVRDDYSPNVPMCSVQSEQRLALVARLVPPLQRDLAVQLFYIDFHCLVGEQLDREYLGLADRQLVHFIEFLRGRFWRGRRLRAGGDAGKKKTKHKGQKSPASFEKQTQDGSALNGSQPGSHRISRSPIGDRPKEASRAPIVSREVAESKACPLGFRVPQTISVSFLRFRSLTIREHLSLRKVLSWEDGDGVEPGMEQGSVFNWNSGDSRSRRGRQRAKPAAKPEAGGEGPGPAGAPNCDSRGDG